MYGPHGTPLRRQGATEKYRQAAGAAVCTTAMYRLLFREPSFIYGRRGVVDLITIVPYVT